MVGLELKISCLAIRFKNAALILLKNSNDGTAHSMRAEQPPGYIMRVCAGPAHTTQITPCTNTQI